MLIDTHAHLYWESFKEDFEEVIQRCLESEVLELINVGVDVKTSEIALKMQNEKVKFYSSIGIHPHEAIKYASKSDVSIQQDIEKLEELYISDPKKVVLVGECGQDFLFSNNPDSPTTTLTEEEQKDLQRKLLKAQVSLAKKLNLPLTIHVRDDRSKNPENSECWNEAVDLAKDHFGIFHCYSGLAETTQRILKETNFLISFAATITYPKNNYLREAAKVIPLDRIVVETDCPFLPPQAKRGQRNEPSYILETAECLAEVKGISLVEVANQTTQNIKKLLKLS